VVSGRVEVRGTLAAFFFDGHASGGSGTLDVRGPVRIDRERSVDLHVSASAVDLHALAAAAPSSRLAATGDVRLTVSEAGELGESGVITVSGIAGGVRVPEVAAVVLMKLPASADKLAFDIAAAVPRLDAVTGWPRPAGGRVRASARGTLDLRSMGVDAQVRAAAWQIAAGQFRLGQANLSGHASGSISAPALEVELRCVDLDAFGVQLSEVQADVRGHATSADVSLSMHGGGASVEATATVDAESGGIAVRGLRVFAQRGNQGARLRASLVTWTPPEQRVDGAEVLGLGEPLWASARVRPGSWVVSAHSRGLDLGSLARLAGRPEIAAGRIVIDAEATLRRSRADGHVALDVTCGTTGPWRGAEAHADLTLAGRHVSGVVSAGVAEVGSIDVRASSEVGGDGPLGLSSYKTLWGTADVQMHAEIAKLAAMLPFVLPGRGWGGALDVRAHVARGSAVDASPDADVWAQTRGLVVPGVTGSASTLRGLSGEGHLTVAGHDARTSIDARVTDATGVILGVEATSLAVPYARLFSSAEPRLAILRTMASRGSMTVPERYLAAFPAFLGTQRAHGLLSARLTWSGTPDRPTLDAHATLRRGQAVGASPDLPFDLVATAHYDGARVDGSLVAISPGSTQLAATAEIDARATDLFEKRSGLAFPWRASGKATLTDFPLQSLALFDARPMSGSVSGDVSLEGLNEDARVALDLTASHAIVGGAACDRMTFKASFDGHTVDASARVDQGDGTLRASGRAGAHWGAAMGPTLDDSQPATLQATARSLRAALLLPLLAGVFTQLDGRIDGDVSAQFDPTTAAFVPRGTVRLSDGRFELPIFGAEFHDVSGEIAAAGDGLVRLQKASATGLGGKVDAAATARFSGLRFVSARAVVHVPHNEPLPVAYDGVQIGTFDGQLSVDVDPADTGPGLDVKVVLDRTLLELPFSSDRNVQPLSRLANVSVGVERRDGPFSPFDGPDLATTSAARPAAVRKLTIALGSDVEIKRGAGLDVRLAGSTTLTMTHPVHAAGQVQLVRGTIDIQGKVFTLESGAITFVDDPTDPQVALAASWPAPDGTTIHADFVGSLKTGKVRLRAEPPRPQNEILSLLLFGTSESQAPSAAGLSAQQWGAVGAAAGVAAAPINESLRGFNQMLARMGLGGGGGIAVKVDTSQPTPRPEIELPIARDISLQIAWVPGVLPGGNPDTELSTFSWRFLPNWSFDATVGDAGTSILDLVWHHRY
jgi:translocation and assembly module TamB